MLSNKFYPEYNPRSQSFDGTLRRMFSLEYECLFHWNCDTELYHFVALATDTYEFIDTFFSYFNLSFEQLSEFKEFSVEQFVKSIQLKTSRMFVSREPVVLYAVMFETTDSYHCKRFSDGYRYGEDIEPWCVFTYGIKSREFKRVCKPSDLFIVSNNEYPEFEKWKLLVDPADDDHVKTYISSDVKVVRVIQLQRTSKQFLDKYPQLV